MFSIITDDRIRDFLSFLVVVLHAERKCGVVMMVGRSCLFHSIEM